MRCVIPRLGEACGILSLLVLTACGGGGGGAVSPLPNVNPGSAPALTSIAPGTTAAGSAGFQLVASGTGFTSSSQVLWNASARTTTFIGPTEVRAAILAGDVASAGSVPITVANGNLTSNAITFTITSPPVGGGQIMLISVATDGSAGNGDSFSTPAVTPDARFVAFQSDATNLVTGAASGFSDIYVRDTCIGAAAGCQPTTTRVSVNSNGALADGNSRRPSISANGRYVAFDSSATNLVPNDMNGTQGPLTGLADIFVRDTCLGAAGPCTPVTVRVSVDSAGTEANNDSRRPSVSADGRYVVFNSAATNLISGDTNGFGDLFLRDTCIGAAAGCVPSTSRISLANDGSQANGASGLQAASPDMRFVAFFTTASNLVLGDTNGLSDYFVRDTCINGPAGCAPGTIRVSIANDGSQANGLGDLEPTLSADGRWVAFTSHATNLVPGDTNSRADIFVRDTCTGHVGCAASTFRASVASDGSQANSGSEAPSMSTTGRFVAFSSLATNLMAGGTTTLKSIFVRDTCLGVTGCVPTTVLVGRSATGAQDNGVSEFPAITADGRWVAFLSNSTNLAPSATNGKTHTLLARTDF
jgi:Tol biopolymer transport system component